MSDPIGYRIPDIGARIDEIFIHRHQQHKRKESAKESEATKRKEEAKNEPFMKEKEHEKQSEAAHEQKVTSENLNEITQEPNRGRKIAGGASCRNEDSRDIGRLILRTAGRCEVRSSKGIVSTRAARKQLTESGESMSGLPSMWNPKEIGSGSAGL